VAGFPATAFPTQLRLSRSSAPSWRLGHHGFRKSAFECSRGAAPLESGAGLRQTATERFDIAERITIVAMLRSTVLTAVLLGGALQGAPLTPLTINDTSGARWTLFASSAHHLDVLFFLSTECPISNRYAPEIQRICSDYRGRGVRCFAVYPDAGADLAAVAAHRREYRFSASIPAFVDRDHTLVAVAGARVTPEAAIFGPPGRMYHGRIDDLYADVGLARRAASRHDVRLALDAALNGEKVTETETEAVGCAIGNP
jgi:hypothetical protein